MPKHKQKPTTKRPPAGRAVDRSQSAASASPSSAAPSDVLTPVDSPQGGYVLGGGGLVDPELQRREVAIKVARASVHNALAVEGFAGNHPMMLATISAIVFSAAEAARTTPEQLLHELSATVAHAQGISVQALQLANEAPQPILLA